MPLEKWAEALALRFQEDATTLSHSDICKALCDALKELYPGQYCYPTDVYGDDSSGDVVFCCGGDYKRAPYEIQMIGGKRACSIDTSQAVDVLPRTVYDEEADEADHYANMGEAERAGFVERFPGSAGRRAPISERFISKAERDAADSGSFAGKGKSFPILKPADVMAAVRSMGRAGADNKSSDALKSSIIRIAKKKGWGKYLPKAWQTSDGDASKEAAAWDLEAREVRLVESAVAFPAGFRFEEADAVNPVVKIIDPGRGSSGYYTKEVLQRDGPEIFKAGTLMYVNHATAAEESARPEGDWTKLAAVTVGNAYWDDNGKDGAALYAPAKVFSDYATQVKEKAPFTGVSVRARGRLNEKKIAPDGRPGVIEALTYGDSIDLVTKAGRGGKLLLEAENAVRLYEAARGRESTQGDNDMDEATVKRLIAEATAPLVAENKKLKEAIAAGEAPKVKRGKTIRKMLEAINLPSVYKDLIVERVKADYPLTEAGVTDEKRLKEAVDRELQRVAKQLSRETGQVVNLGPPATIDPKVREAAGQEWEKQFTESLNSLADEFLDHNEESDEKAVERRRKLFTLGRTA